MYHHNRLRIKTNLPEKKYRYIYNLVHFNKKSFNENYL